MRSSHEKLVRVCWSLLEFAGACWGLLELPYRADAKNVAAHQDPGQKPPPWTAAARSAWVRGEVPHPGGRTHPAVATAPPSGRQGSLPSAAGRNKSCMGC